jgi:hypothetical protein
MPSAARSATCSEYRWRNVETPLSAEPVLRARVATLEASRIIKL